MNGQFTIFVLALLLQTPAFSCDEHGQTGILPENDMWIGVREKSDEGGISQDEFNKVIDDIQAIYAPIIEAKGKRLKIIRDWKSGTVNAMAYRQGRSWMVHMHGGLARHKTIDKEGFALVVCHELGHHLGGAPKKRSFWGSTWASNEGQADYWANLKCMRKYYEDQDNLAKLKDLGEIDPTVKRDCESEFADANDRAICIRSALGGQSLANLFAAFSNRAAPKFNTRDGAVVSKTFDSHPKAQCRLDTYFQAALCREDAYVDVSNRDPLVGTCNRSRGDEVGTRPLCWYKP